VVALLEALLRRLNVGGRNGRESHFMH
jgi:hypothetical protein